MIKKYLPAFLLATVLGAALVARSRRSSSTSTTTGTDTPTTPDPDPDETPFRIIGRIDLTQFRPGQSYRRGRIRGQRVSESDRSATQAERTGISSL